MQGNSIIGEIYTWGEKNIKKEQQIINVKFTLVYFNLQGNGKEKINYIIIGYNRFNISNEDLKYSFFFFILIMM